MFDWLYSVRQGWDNLSDRERRMLSIMGGVLVAVVAFAVVWTTTSALAEVEEERDAVRQVLADIDRAQELLAKRDAERRAVEALYRNKAPALGSYVESRAKEENIEVRQVLEEPEKNINGYRKQSVRVSFSNVALRPMVHLLTRIAEERSPIAIERLVVEHFGQGDSYKVDVHVASYEAPSGAQGKRAGATP